MIVRFVMKDLAMKYLYPLWFWHHGPNIGAQALFFH